MGETKPCPPPPPPPSSFFGYIEEVERAYPRKTTKAQDKIILNKN